MMDLQLPWHLVARDLAGAETSLEAAASLQIRGTAFDAVGGVPLMVGSVPLTFRPVRSGSHRGGQVAYGSFSAQDLAKARLLAGGPELLDVLQALWQWQRTCQELLPDGLADRVQRSILAVGGMP
jgi:hypothetical protein